MQPKQFLNLQILKYIRKEEPGIRLHFKEKETGTPGMLKKKKERESIKKTKVSEKKKETTGGTKATAL